MGLYHLDRRNGRVLGRVVGLVCHRPWALRGFRTATLLFAGGFLPPLANFVGEPLDSLGFYSYVDQTVVNRLRGGIILPHRIPLHQATGGIGAHGFHVNHAARQILGVIQFGLPHGGREVASAQRISDRDAFAEHGRHGINGLPVLDGELGDTGAHPGVTRHDEDVVGIAHLVLVLGHPAVKPTQSRTLSLKPKPEALHATLHRGLAIRHFVVRQCDGGLFYGQLVQRTLQLRFRRLHVASGLGHGCRDTAAFVENLIDPGQRRGKGIIGLILLLLGGLD